MSAAASGNTEKLYDDFLPRKTASPIWELFGLRERFI
jgi:hypothetical protein